MSRTAKTVNKTEINKTLKYNRMGRVEEDLSIILHC